MRAPFSFLSSVVLLGLLINMVGCSRDEYVIGNLGIDNIDILFSENQSDYIIVMVYGSVPDGCESLHETRHSVKGNTINIRITTKEVIDYEPCTTAVEEFQIPVYIGQWDAIGAYDEYKINVNGVTEVFRIEGDEIWIIRELDIHGISIDASESKPAQVTVLVGGYFWEECVEFIEIHHERDGNTVNIEIEAKIPSGTLCPSRFWDTLTEYQEAVDIGTFTTGEYKVVVNGHENIFRIN